MKIRCARPGADEAGRVGGEPRPRLGRRWGGGGGVARLGPPRWLCGGCVWNGGLGGARHRPGVESSRAARRSQAHFP